MVAGFTPTSQAQAWQYGKTQDTAQSHTTDGSSALANFSVTLTLNGSNFSYMFPSYSMTVLDLTPAGGPARNGVPVPAGAGTSNAVALAAVPFAPEHTVAWASLIQAIPERRDDYFRLL